MPPSHLLADSSVSVVVGWIFSADDCLVCVTPAAALRHVAIPHGVRIRLRAIGIGGDRAVIDGFFRRERIAAEVILLSESESRSALGKVARPSLFLISDGTVAAAWVGARAIQAATAGDYPLIVRLMDSVVGLPPGKPITGM